VRRALLALLALLCLSALAAGCGRQPVSNDRAQDESTDETTAESTGETTSETTGSTAVGDTPELAAATEEYEEYVADQLALLEERTRGFTDAVLAGEVEKAKGLYAPAREPWERVEPVAASFGDYDPKIDAREGDVADEDWRGFHRIEKSLWAGNTTQGQEEYARQLMEDVENLREEAEGVELEPADLVAGSVELLNEVSAGKITGEEDRYSHTDLYDINANVEGSEVAFEQLKPEVAGEDMTLANEVKEGFDGVHEELDQYREGDGWVSYETLDEADRRALSQKIDALAEPLSRVGGVLEG